MQRHHYWVMGLAALLYGIVVVLDYAAVQYRLSEYLGAFSEAQQEWFTSLPAWVDAVWGAQALLAFAGAIALVLTSSSAVWLLGFAFIANLILTLWMLAIATPSMVSVTGWIGCAIMSASLGGTLLFWLYARSQKQSPDGLL